MGPSLSLSKASKTFRTLFHRLPKPKRSISLSLLFNLPLELLLQICAFLDTPALCSIRLTCKSLYNCAFSQFCQSHLRNLTTDLSQASLHRLDTLLQNPELSPHFRSLRINGTEDDILGSGLQWERDPTSGLIVTSQDSIRQWQGVVLRLNNCQSFRIYKHCPTDHPSPPDEFTHCDTVTVILKIIAAIESPLQELALVFKGPHLTGANLIDMARVDDALLHDPKFVTCCSTLEALTFACAIDSEKTANFISQIIKYAATRLQRLKMDVDHGVHSRTMMSNLYSAQLPLRLRELELDSGYIGSDHDLIGFLAFSKQSLVSITFTAVYLNSGEWRHVFRALADFPSLTEIYTFLLSQPDYRVHFPDVLHDSVVDPVLGTRLLYRSKKLNQQQTSVMVAYCSHVGMDIALHKMADLIRPL